MRHSKIKQNDILNYIASYTESHQYSPSVREIADGVGVKSTSTIQNHLDQMIEMGILETDTKPRQPRAIRIPGYQYIKTECDYAADDWIPCTAFLPEDKINPITKDFFEYEVTFQSADILDIRHYKFGEGHWWNYGGIMDKYVTAWRKRPKPYRRSE